MFGPRTLNLYALLYELEKQRFKYDFMIFSKIGSTENGIHYKYRLILHMYE